MSDNVSLSSWNSRRSTPSFRSRGSVRSSRSKKSVKSGNQSRKGGRKTDRYGALPFDEGGTVISIPVSGWPRSRYVGCVMCNVSFHVMC